MGDYSELYQAILRGDYKKLGRLPSGHFGRRGKPGRIVRSIYRSRLWTKWDAFSIARSTSCQNY